MRVDRHDVISVALEMEAMVMNDGTEGENVDDDAVVDVDGLI